MAGQVEIAIVGAGAAGLAAAIGAGEAAGPLRPRPRIGVLDRHDAGRKILLAGGGRCNLTHAAVAPGDYHGAGHALRNILASFDAAAARAWFKALDLPLANEADGRVFPARGDSHAVLAALLRRCRETGVALWPGHGLRSIDLVNGGAGESRAPGFLLRHELGELAAAKVILATGGCSYPATGSDGAAFAIVRRLGHSVTPLFPALAPLKLSKTFFHAGLSGVALPAELSLDVDGRRAVSYCGDLLFTHFGLSGPVALNISGAWGQARARSAAVTLRAAFFPGQELEAAAQWLLAAAQEHPKKTLRNVLSQRLPGRLAEICVGQAGLDAELKMGRLSREQRRKIAVWLTGLALPVQDTLGWDHAEVTAGGVPLAEISSRTMESCQVKGLYLAGEMLDCDGRLGGFNLHWAWATGRLAGQSAARSLAQITH